MTKKCILKFVSILLATAILIAILIGIGFIFRSIYSVKLTEIYLQNELHADNNLETAFVYRKSLFLRNKEYNLHELSYRHNKDYEAEQIFCIYDNRVYFSISYSEKDMWYLASVSIDDMDFAIHTQLCTDKKYSFGYYHNTAFSDRCAYYYEKKIVLNDGEKVLEYDLATGTENTFETSSYVFPAVEQIGSVIDEQTILLFVDEAEQTYTLQQMAEANQNIASVFSFKNKKRWDGEMCLNDFFFKNSFVAANDRIFLIGQLHCYSGDSFAVLFEYDLEKGQWIYITGYHIGGVVESYCSVVPILIE